ncbi:MAG: winged helix-turn-helix transcriptional regulator [Desulfobacterales bacterium]|nr:winged helix-turn-helix transcriptional regulator [Desulfobacterales bacterium]MCP4161792.1 winged helix-turn-helix transcriptional regulator [Deltaproteobacteria bacterium]
MNAILSKTPSQSVDELVDTLDSRFFKALSEPVRVQILKFLILNGKSDIAAISEDLPQDRSVISRHLQFMFDVDILDCEKITRHKLYEINGEAFISKLESILGKIRECMPECCPVDKEI